MTTFKWATCDCITTYTDDEELALTRYDRKCSFHQKVSDNEAWNEIKSAHLTKALTVKAARLAVYGDERNPVKYGFGPDFTASLEEREGNKRVVVLDGSSVPANRRASVISELSKISSEHSIELKTR